jgi:pyruvate dehydrogenase E1 component alpha subunit
LYFVSDFVFRITPFGGELMELSQLKTDFKPGFLKKLLSDMQLIRRFEEEASRRYGLREFGGFLHLYIGQEAVAVGAVSAIGLKNDYILTAYRDHGFALAVGMEPKTVMAELYGRAAGCSKGKGGSMHMFDVEKHFFGGNGIVGAHIPPATGVALKIRYNKENGVVLCFFGDGAIHQGTFWESANMARVWQLPIVYICENNQYGMGTDFRRVSAKKNLAEIACAFDFPGKQVDGMDILEVRSEIAQAVERARTEHIPTLIEARTYRYVGHSISDPATYRTKEEVGKYKLLDPILIFKDKLLKAQVITDEEFVSIDNMCKAAVAQAVQFAQQSPDPKIESIYEDVLA